MGVVTVADVTWVGDFELPAQMEGQDAYRPDFAAALVVTSPVRPDQLAVEVAEQAGLSDVALQSDGDPAQASPEGPVHVWTATDVPADLLAEVAGRHRPDPDWVAGAPSGAPRIEQILDKVSRRQMLSPAEVQAALRHLLLPAAGE